ncbi:efflux transporter, RND family, MFP subunit [Chthoniobacter flavus Ellin428]|uniref:Efflux transporter, RND family, MFP subunit n=1 Tax=Chthoniobacter flavus Ellin428 TaxID=497964 RepID=B4D7Y1_9BACT|nr:efflux RND transporter periplasmic adaptor subunit [Chthoniobacter flavus]EDY17504.1 efflux transporter, RND family, MFP subunit [Chthoniobacter flavus Ellin428]TCO92299.1 HlyD family secretion protein [Chthoniobacter flavus]
MKTLFTLLIIAGLLAGGWWYYKRNQNNEPQFLTATIEKGSLTKVVTATGTLNPVLNVTVGSQISGNIVKLYADWNSPVKANQVVAQIDPAVYVANVDQCNGDLANAKAVLELAQLTAKRKQELVEQHAAPQADLDTAIATLHQAEATVKVKEANLELAKVNLEHCTIYSPVDGIVISRSVDVGQTVAAAMNAPVLFLIANDLTKMQIDSNVAEADVGNVEVGQDVDFSVDAFPYRTFHGKVVQNRNAAVTVQNVVTYDVVISVDNSDLKLKPGMTATVQIIISRKDDVLKIPNAALRIRTVDADATPAPISPQPTPTPPPVGKHHTSGRTRAEKRDRTVFVMPPGGGKPKPVPIKLGIDDLVYTEVTDGLKEGDVVVTSVEFPQKSSHSGSSNPFGGMPRRF